MWMASKGHLRRARELARRVVHCETSHFLGQIPHPMHSSSEMNATFLLESTSIHSFPVSAVSGLAAGAARQEEHRTHAHDGARLLALLAALLGLAAVGVHQRNTSEGHFSARDGVGAVDTEGAALTRLLAWWGLGPEGWRWKDVSEEAGGRQSTNLRRRGRTSYFEDTKGL